MPLLTPADLFDAAMLRYSQSVLRTRMRGAPDAANQDIELKKIAATVFNRVAAAASVSIGWPLPGQWPVGSLSPLDGVTDISGQPYTDFWPAELWERALQLFNFWTMAGMDNISSGQVKKGEQTERWFTDLERGGVPLLIGGRTDAGPRRAFSSRDRSGRALVAGLRDTDTVYEDRSGNSIFSGQGWDRAR